MQDFALSHDLIYGEISAQLRSTLCIQFLDRENNDKNNTFPLGKQICFTVVWSCAEILPISGAARKEAKGGRTYESNVGLNFNLSETSGEVNITLSNTEFCSFRFKRQNKKNIQM